MIGCLTETTICVVATPLVILKRGGTESADVALQPNLKVVFSESPVLDSALMVQSS